MSVGTRPSVEVEVQVNLTTYSSTILFGYPLATMDKLPPEILRGILGALVALNPSSKNDILPFRLVCKVFNELLREDLLKTIQLDFSRLERNGNSLDLKYLAGAADYCDAIYVDLTIIRDDGKPLLVNRQESYEWNEQRRVPH